MNRPLIVTVGPCVGKTTMALHSLAASVGASLVILPPHIQPSAVDVLSLQPPRDLPILKECFALKKTRYQRAHSNAPFYRNLPKFKKRKRL